METSSSFYQDASQAKSVANFITLQDAGSYWLSQSFGGFPGQIVIENILGNYLSIGKLLNLVDGKNTSYYEVFTLVPSPIKSSSEEIPWLPANNQDGFAVQYTYYIDRTIALNQVRIDPISESAFTLLSIGWSSVDKTSVLPTGFSSWSTTGSASFLSSSSIAHVKSPSGHCEYTFLIPTTAAVSGGSQLQKSPRCEFEYEMYGYGAAEAGARIDWLDSSGKIIKSEYKKDYPTGNFTKYLLVGYFPSNAASGIVKLGYINSTNSLSSAFFRNPKLYVGENVVYLNEEIDREKYLSLPFGAISSRFTFTFVQKNPSLRHLFLDKKPTKRISLSQLSEGSRTMLQESMEQLSKSFEDTSLAYNIGIRELDLGYIEFLPVSKLVSLPINSKNEIREIDVFADLNSGERDSVAVYAQPYPDDQTKMVRIKPSFIQDGRIISGEKLKIFTFEEVAAGYASAGNEVYIVSPISHKEIFDGTTPDGKVVLGKPLHVSRPKITNLRDWLKTYSIISDGFDPNAETLAGVSNTTKLNQLRKGVSVSLEETDIIVSKGYVPIKITIETPEWTAVPDLYGSIPGNNLIAVEQEELVNADAYQNIVTQATQNQSYKTWLSLTTGNDLKAIYPNLEQTGLSKDLVTKLVAEPNKSLVQISGDNDKLVFLYEKLKSEGKLSKTGSIIVTNQTTLTQEYVYATKHFPLVVNNSNFRLYLYSNTASTFQQWPYFEILNKDNGLIHLTKTPPAGYDTLYADYVFLSMKENDLYSNVLTYLDKTNVAASGVSDNLRFVSRSYPVTRNITDYTGRRDYKFKRLNMDRNSKDYYPVIEYYIDSSNEIVFSREFFKFGDMPGTITVEVDTLNINPRIHTYLFRSGSYGYTPKLKSLIINTAEVAN